MMKLTQSAFVTSGLRGFACAGLATLITALFSWSFVTSTENLNWMGSRAQGYQAAEILQASGV